MSVSHSETSSLFQSFDACDIVNGIGNGDDVEVAGEETSDKHIVPNVRDMINSYNS